MSGKTVISFDENGTKKTGRLINNVHAMYNLLRVQPSKTSMDRLTQTTFCLSVREPLPRASHPTCCQSCWGDCPCEPTYKD